MNWIPQPQTLYLALAVVGSLIYLVLAYFQTGMKRGEGKGWVLSLLCGLAWPIALWYDMMIMEAEIEAQEHKNWSN